MLEEEIFRELMERKKKEANKARISTGLTLNTFPIPYFHVEKGYLTQTGMQKYRCFDLFETVK